MDRRLNICQFIYDHPDNPWCGGGGAIRAWAVNEILTRRHNITVFCGAFPGAKHRGEPYPVNFIGGGRRYVISRLRFMAAAHRIDPRGYDLIVDEFSYYAPLLPRTGGRPLVTVLHGRHGLNPLRWRGVYGLLSLFSEYLLLPTRRAVILVSAHLRTAVHRKARTAVIGQGVNLPDPLPPSGADYVLYIGRLDIWHKGIDVLVAAWSRIPVKDRSLPLLIAGGGDMAPVRQMMEHAEIKDARLTGKLSHDNAIAAIRRSAFVVMPSRMEGSPLVLYEALALGKPVVGAAIPPIAALLPDGQAGRLVAPDDIDAWTAAIRTLMQDDVMRMRMGNEAARIGQRFQWHRQARAQERFYFDVMADQNERK